MSEDHRQVIRLEWGVKQSFRNYVEAVGGVIETHEGAQRTKDGAFVFTAVPGQALQLGPDGVPVGRGQFQGEVRFDAHGGMLKVCVADPILEFGPDGAVLTFADSPARNRRVEIAQLELKAISRGDSGEILIPTLLTMDGSLVLGDHYPPRTPLDPVRLILA